MKIFGSISELVDLAFRLAGGKQVKLRSATQTTSGTLVTVNVPDVAATGDTQSMVLTAATQTLSNKTLSSPTITAGTINNAIIGGSTPAAGSFTAIVGDTLDINTSAELQALTIPSFSSAQGGILHSAPTTGVISSSKVVDADVDAAAAIAFSKLAGLASAEILVGSGAGVATARAMSGDVTIDNLGATSIGAGKVTDSMLAGSITRTKLATGNNYRILANNSSGQMSENAALTANEAVATDGNGQLVTVTGVSATELGYLSNVTSDIQTQISAKANSGANSDITSLSGLTTALSGAQGGTGVANTGKTITLGGNLVTSGNFTTTLTATNTTNVTLPTSGTLATTSNKLSAFAATSSSELAGVISDETGSGSLVFGTNPTLATPTLNGHKYGVSGSLTVSSNTLTPTADRSIQVIGTGATLQMIDNPADGQEFILINASGSDFTIANNTGATAANRIYTGTGADYTFKANSSVSVVYNSTLSRWVLAGGGGAGGGLTPSPLATTLNPAVAGTHYLTNTSGGAFTATLPSGVAGAVIRFSDANETWDTYQLTITPASGQKIDNLATNESLVCDVKRGWVELSWNTALSSWSIQSLSSVTASTATTTNPGVITLKAPTQTVFFTPGSGTYTVPAGVLYLKIRAVGGGGGGGGGGTAGGAAAGAGGNTSFVSGATTLFTVNGGGAASYYTGGSGGTYSQNLPANSSFIAYNGAQGNAGQQNTAFASAGMGNSTAFGPGGGGGASGVAGGAAGGAGAGGGGGGAGGANGNGGGGGGSSAYIEATIRTLAASYTYTVGAFGAAGGAGTGGAAGGAGGNGVIVIDEYYY